MMTLSILIISSTPSLLLIGSFAPTLGSARRSESRQISERVDSLILVPGLIPFASSVPT